MPIPLLYEEHTASTLPDAATMDDQVIYRRDLHQFWHSDGITWRVLTRPDYDAAWSDSTGTALVRPDGVRMRMDGYRYTSQRPYLCSFGDSINSQDVPSDADGPNAPGVGPTTWINALCCGAFDYMRFDTTLSAPGGSQSSSQIFRNGMSGSSGGLVTDRGKYGIDPFLTTILANAGGRPFVVLLLGGVNDYANNDTAGHDATIWADLRTIIQKVQDAGGLPLVKVNEPTLSLDTITKRRNRAALADTVQTWAAGRTDVAVMDVEAAWRKYGQGVTWERATRGATGDQVHPNNIGAVIHGFAGREALRGFVRFDPPWARSDFANTIIGANPLLTGTSGTEGGNIDTAGEVATGWTAVANNINVQMRADSEVGPEGPGMRLVMVPNGGAPVPDTFGLYQSTNPAPTVGTVVRAWQDVDIVKADYVDEHTFRVCTTGSTFVAVGGVGSTDKHSMTAASGTTPMSPSAPKLLEGNRVVLSSHPAVVVSSPKYTMYEVGGGLGLTSTSSRYESFVRFAGLISY